MWHSSVYRRSYPLQLYIYSPFTTVFLLFLIFLYRFWYLLWQCKRMFSRANKAHLNWIELTVCLSVWLSDCLTVCLSVCRVQSAGSEGEGTGRIGSDVQPAFLVWGGQSQSICRDPREHHTCPICHGRHDTPQTTVRPSSNWLIIWAKWLGLLTGQLTIWLSGLSLMTDCRD